MRRFFLMCLLPIFLATGVFAQPQADEYPYDLTYFLPEGSQVYDPQVPTPEKILGFQLGEQHAGWDQVVEYMRTLARCSDRVTIRETGRTYQHRPFIEVVFTSAENQKNIDRLKEEHLKLSDVAKSRSIVIDDMPVIVSLIYSIHGNEASGVNASLAVAYHLAAAQGPEIEELLDQEIVVMTPGANPDGINRFASWVNSSRSFTNVSDIKSREFTEPWPSSRTNHYWIDCNRDLLMAQHPEGINGLNGYFEWLPNVVVDQHEQGALRPYYFSPGHPKRTHPFTPQLNQDLTAEISSYTAKALDRIGTTYYSKEGYDDFYYGKGAAYGDAHGSVCLLYEQGSTRGHLRNTPSGEWTFGWTIRNQALASCATLEAAKAMRTRLLAYQKEYYERTASEVRKEAVQGYVFDTRGSKSVAFHFLENMARHHIEVYQLAKDYQAAGNKEFQKGSAYVIPVAQKYSTMVKVLMEDCLEYTDSTFYDISTWTFPHAFNLECAPVKSVAGLMGDRIERNDFPQGRLIGGESRVGYVFENREFYAPKVVYELQRKGIRVSATNRPFQFKNEEGEWTMGYGTYQVLTHNQPLPSDVLYATLDELAENTGVDIYSANTGLMADVDFGSPAFKPLEQPKVAMLVGRGVSIPESGEIWFLLDKRFQMRPVLIENPSLTGKDLKAYNVIILANGVPNLTKGTETALKEWVAAGGVLIATGKASAWASKQGLISLKTKETLLEKADSLSVYRSFADKAEAKAGKLIKGVILNCHLDKTHPLAWGLDQDEIAVIKTNDIIFQKDRDPYISPLYYTKKCTFLQVFPRTFCIACINRDFRQSAFQKTVQFANEKGLPCGSPLFQRFCSALSGSVIFRHLSSQIFQYVVGVAMFSVRGGVELDHISAIPEYGIDVSSRVSTVGLQFLCRHRCLLIKGNAQTLAGVCRLSQQLCVRRHIRFRTVKRHTVVACPVVNNGIQSFALCHVYFCNTGFCWFCFCRLGFSTLLRRCVSAGTARQQHCSDQSNTKQFFHKDHLD